MDPDLSRITILVFGVFVLIGTVIADNLLLVQPVWRHGDRTPTGTYRTDPNQEDAWPIGFGQLTPKGMDQHVHLGNALYEEYMVKNKFLNKSLNYWEMYIRSTDANRTLISAYSNLIGMYNDRGQAQVDVDYPSDHRWPPHFVPFPVHTITRKIDHVGDVLSSKCPRRDWLLEMSKKAHEFVKLREDNQQFLDELSKICGEKIDLISLWDVRDATYIEKLYNKPTIINDTLYERIVEIDDQVSLMEDGLDLSPVDGIDFAIEEPKVKGGPLLWTLINNFDLKIFCTQPNNSMKSQCKWMKNLKYYAYSFHDTTMSALMCAMRARKKIVKRKLPDYAACLVFELWNTTNGPALRVIYRKDSAANFEDVTHMINGCENLSAGKCPYDRMRESAKTFYPGDITKLCEDTTSISTDMWKSRSNAT